MIDYTVFAIIYLILAVVEIAIASYVDIKLYFKKETKGLVEDNPTTPKQIKREYVWTNIVETSLFTLGFWLAFILIKFGVLGV